MEFAYAHGRLVLQVPAALLAHLTFTKLFCSSDGLRVPMKGPAAGLQMAVCLDKTLLLPRPCDITQNVITPAYKNPSVLVR